MNLDTVLAVLAGASPILLLLIGAWLKRRNDRAVVEKTEADARVSMVTAEKVKAETDSFVLENAVKLVDEFKKQQAEKDALHAAQIASNKEKITGLEGRIWRMEEGFSRLRAALATHGVWDADALVHLRKNVDVDYPDPPHIPQILE